MTPTSFEHGQAPVAGILLTNLGTPDQPTAPALRRYLAEFLWDPRVVELPRPLWWLILHGVILRVRPPRSAQKYQAIWSADGSPLLAITRRQAEALAAGLNATTRGPIEVEVGMRYGNPSLASALERLRAAGVRRLLVLPLYPQYSAATTASTFDALAAALRDWRWLPELRMVTHYHDYPPYLAALAEHIESAWREQPPGQRLLFSFHGLPKRNLLIGDPYHCECLKTARLVAERLALPAERWAVAFQSRFGKAEWLKPYTSEQLEQWAKAGVGSVDVVCPGFAADCLETLEEIAIENRQLFLAAGGKEFRYIPALNDTPRHIAALADLIGSHVQGWPEFAATARTEEQHAMLASSRQRALALGAER
ncbi:MAG: ferrochelatase [Gammaproteobacteria bacterium]